MTDFLFFQLAAPMASWGGIAVGEDRQSALYPSRSAVIGILASALGARRNEEERQRHLAAGYKVAVVTCDPGELLRDYHTTQVPSSLDSKGWSLRTRRDEVAVIDWNRQNKGRAGEAILSARDYRCDGRWIVAIQVTADAPHSLETLKGALCQPVFCLFLGRKSCPPALPLQAQLIGAPTLIDALRELRFDSADDLVFGDRHSSVGQRRHLCSLYWEAGMTMGLDPQDSVERWDEPLSRRRWQFQPRIECHATLAEEVFECS